MGIPPQILSLLANAIGGNATPQGSGTAPAQPDFNMGEAFNAMHFIQEGQEIQRRLAAPELKPTLIEQFMASKVPFAATGLQLKAEQRNQLQNYQMLLAKHLLDSGHENLVPAVFRPMKEDEIGQLTQQYAKAARSKATVEAPYREAMSSTATLDFPPAGGPNQASLFPGYSATQRPATTADRNARVTAGLTNPETSIPMLIAAQSALGANMGRTIQDQLQLVNKQQSEPTPAQRQAAFATWQRSEDANTAKTIATTPTPEDKALHRADTQSQIDDRTARRTDARERHTATLALAERRLTTTTEQLELARERHTFAQERHADEMKRSGAASKIAEERLKETTKRREFLEKKHADELKQRDDAQKLLNDIDSLSGKVTRTFTGPQAQYAQKIRDEATRQGVNPELALALILQESNLDPNRPGDGGKAIGFGQLHVGAASDVGMTPEDRHDPEKNIKGTIAYLKKKLAQAGGNEDKALLLYNGGGDPNYVANVRRHMQQSQYTTPQGAAQSQTDLPPGLEPYTRLKNAGTSVSSTGRVTTNIPQVRQESAEAYIDKAMNTDGSLIPAAIAEAGKRGDNPSTERLKFYRSIYSNGAMLYALQDPTIEALPPEQRYQAALRMAAQQSSFFDPELVKNLADPAAQAAGIEIAKQKQQTTPLADSVAAKDATRKGTEARTVAKERAQGEVEGRTEIMSNPSVSIFNAFGEGSPPRYTKFYDTKTGKKLTAETPAPTALTRLNDGTAVELSGDEPQKLQALQSAAAGLKPLFTLYEKLYGPSGEFAKLSAAGRIGNAPGNFLKILSQTNPTLVSAIRATEPAATSAARLMGQSGTLSDLDMENARKSLVSLGAFVDRPEVAQEMIYTLIDILDGKMGSLLQNPKHRNPDIYRPYIVTTPKK